MAKGSMTLNTSIRLNSSQFKRGIKEVQRSLNSLKSSFMSLAGALGAGMGFGKLIASAKDTAQSLSVAKAVLENVSQEVDEAGNKWSSYASNLEYVRKISKQYGQDFTNLIEGFAQFHAAANSVLDANGKIALSLEDQKYIYEQLTRAAAGYHMTADRSKDMMNAVSQMLSKGKVAAEELRRQLGNALPGAFGLMATALGVTTAELEDMMKQGKLVASEALLPFAQELERITKDMSFDSLQQSLNRLKNSWTELVESNGVESMYKGLIDAANKVLEYTTQNITAIKSTIKGALAGLGAYFTAKVVLKVNSGIKSMREEWAKTFDEAATELGKLTNKAKRFEEDGFMKVTKGGVKQAVYRTTNLGIKKDLENYQSAIKLANQYNQALLKLHQSRKNLIGRGLLTKEAIRNIKEAEKTFQRMGTVGKGLESSTHGLNRGWLTLAGIFRNIWIAAKGIVTQLAAFAIVGAIVGWISSIRDKQKQIKEYAEETARIYENYDREIRKIDEVDSEQIINLKTQLKILGECERGSKEWAGALAEVNKKLNLQGNEMLTIESKYDDIANAVNKWIARLKIVSKINRQITFQEDFQSQAEDVRNQIRAYATKYKAKTGDELAGVINLETGQWNQEQLNKGNIKRRGDIEKHLMPYIKRLKELKSSSDAADASIEELTKDLYKYYGTATDGTPIVTSGETSGGTGGKKSEIAEILDKFTKEKEELTNKLKEHAITQEEYNKQFDDLVSKYWQEAAGTGKYSIDDILKKMDAGNALTTMEKWYKDLWEAAQKAAANSTADAASKIIDDAIDEAIKEAQDKLDDFLKEEWDKLADNSKADVENILTVKPKRGKRDTTFDYKKSKADIGGEEFDIATDYAKDLEDKIEDIESKYENLADAAQSVRDKLAEWRKELAKAKAEASTLEEAMKIAQIQEDIDNLQKSIMQTVTGGLRNFAQGVDRIVQGMQTLKETMDDEDSTGWEKFMAVFNEFVQVLETLISAYQAIQTVQDASNEKKKAEISLREENIKLMAAELALKQLLGEQDKQNVKTTEDQAAANLVEAATSRVAGSAAASESIAEGTKSGAKLPFPYNIAAIAASIAAVLGALSFMGKFANGGVINYGSNHGDTTLARVNKGELVMNTAQQAKLWKAIQTGNFGKGGGEVTFRLRGEDIVGSIRNYNSIRRG